MAEFIRAFEIAGRTAKTVYMVGKVTTQFVAERLFTPGAWVPPTDTLNEYIQQVSDESNIIRSEE